MLDADGPKYHPQSWNTNANIFFIDHPVGTGFSYGDMVVRSPYELACCIFFGSILTQSTTEDAARDVAAFISIFFETFTQFEGRALHMAGESYGVSPPCCFSSLASTNDERF